MVDTQMIDIFEACTFQDITGQRIAKVVETLQTAGKPVRPAARHAAQERRGKLSPPRKRRRATRASRSRSSTVPQREGPQVDQRRHRRPVRDCHSLDPCLRVLAALAAVGNAGDALFD
jgi:chemotaxis protein CheZ